MAIYLMQDNSVDFDIGSVSEIEEVAINYDDVNDEIVFWCKFQRTATETPATLQGRIRLVVAYANGTTGTLIDDTSPSIVPGTTNKWSLWRPGWASGRFQELNLTPSSSSMPSNKSLYTISLSRTKDLAQTGTFKLYYTRP